MNIDQIKIYLQNNPIEVSDFYKCCSFTVQGGWISIYEKRNCKIINLLIKSVFSNLNFSIKNVKIDYLCFSFHLRAYKLERKNKSWINDKICDEIVNYIINSGNITYFLLKIMSSGEIRKYHGEIFQIASDIGYDPIMVIFSARIMFGWGNIKMMKIEKGNDIDIAIYNTFSLSHYLPDFHSTTEGEIIFKEKIYSTLQNHKKIDDLDKRMDFIISKIQEIREIPNIKEIAEKFLEITKHPRYVAVKFEN